MAEEIYQIKITLRHINPEIWRRVLVRSGLSLENFHKILQTTMGWTNTHLHQFVKDGKFYAKRMPDDDLWDESDTIDYKNVKIKDLLKEEKDQMIYEYDFGDGWQHDIILEEILPYDEEMDYPVVIDGKRNSPPEDCGGPFGYMQIIQILHNPVNPEYEKYLEWLGEDFDPEYFDEDEINELLQEDNYGCIDF